MRSSTSLLAIIATAASPIFAAPADDVCNLGSSGLDRSPQAAIDGPFRITAQKFDFTGSTVPVAVPKNTLFTSTSQAPGSFTLQDGNLLVGDKPVGYAATAAGNVLSVRNSVSSFGPLTWEARYICDTVQKKAVQVLEATGEQGRKYLNSDLRNGLAIRTSGGQGKITIQFIVTQ